MLKTNWPLFWIRQFNARIDLRLGRSSTFKMSVPTPKQRGAILGHTISARQRFLSHGLDGSVKGDSKDITISQTDEGHAENESMRSDANDNAQVEAEAQFRIFDVSDDELEQAANDHQQAATWSMMPHWWICPV